MGDPKVCEVCGQPIIKGDFYVSHPRLGVHVHVSCPRDNVCGEDITKHTLFWALED